MNYSVSLHCPSGFMRKFFKNSGRFQLEVNSSRLLSSCLLFPLTLHIFNCFLFYWKYCAFSIRFVCLLYLNYFDFFFLSSGLFKWPMLMLQNC